MNVFLWCLYAAAVIICGCFVPLYLQAQRPGKSKKSLALKMVCATMFIAVGFLSFRLGKNGTEYAVYILWALIASWLGDFSLHAGNGKAYFFTGLGFFFLGHVFYLLAYHKAWTFFFSGKPFLRITDIVIVLLLFAVALVYVVRKKLKINIILAAPVAVYTLILLTMLVKASSFAINYFSLTDPNNNYTVLTSIILIIGSLLFVCSDATLGILLFNKKEKENFPLKCFNIITYFSAQILLASTILFIKTKMFDIY